MRVFAVGATGVLGTVLVPLLLERGHRVTVMAPDRLEHVPAGAARVRAGLLDRGIDLAGLVAGHEAVVNLATSMPRDTAAPGAWAENTRIRREGTVRLVAAARAAGARSLVQMSITMAYADGGDAWLAEDTPFDPDPARGALVAPVVDLEAAVRGVPPTELAWTILRGARFAGAGTIQDTQRARLADGTLQIPADGRSFVSMVHVADYAAAVVAAVERAARGRVFNISDRPLRIGDYLTRLARATGAPLPGRAPESVPDLPSHRVDSGAAREELGWRPVRGVLPVPDPASG